MCLTLRLRDSRGAKSCSSPRGAEGECKKTISFFKWSRAVAAEADQSVKKVVCGVMFRIDYGLNGLQAWSRLVTLK